MNVADKTPKEWWIGPPVDPALPVDTGGRMLTLPPEGTPHAYFDIVMPKLTKYKQTVTDMYRKNMREPMEDAGWILSSAVQVVWICASAEFTRQQSQIDALRKEVADLRSMIKSFRPSNPPFKSP